MRKTFFLTAFLMTWFAEAQSLKVGDWRDHLSYKSTYEVCFSEGSVFAATDKALIVFSEQDKSIERLNTLSGLSDSEISHIASRENSLVIAYENGNIDLFESGEIYNIPDLKRASLIGNKKINHIYVNGHTAYLSTGLGIVVLDLDKKEIQSTYFIGENGAHVNVSEITIVEEKMFAATERGLLVADFQEENLADFHAWKVVSEPSTLPINCLSSLNSKLFVNYQSSRYNSDSLYYFEEGLWHLFDAGHSNVSIRPSNDQLVVTRRFGVVIYDASLQQIGYLPSNRLNTDRSEFNACLYRDGAFWIADQHNGLLRYENGQTQVIMPSGPDHSGVAQIKNFGEEIWLAHGAVSENWDPTWSKHELSVLKSDVWLSSSDMVENGFEDIVAINQNQGQMYVASWQDGVAKMNGLEVELIYDESNSSLKKRTEYEDWIEVGDIQFDSKGNMWCTNSQTSKPLSVLYTNGTWESFSIGAGVSEYQDLSKLLIDKNNQKWIQLKNNGLIVFDESRGAANSRKLMNGERQGNLPSDRVFSFAEDLKGNVWVGTENGVGVFYHTEDIFEGENASKIKVTIDGHTTYLLDGQQVNDIEIDGANRKWFALNNAGVIVTSEDGTEEIHHFTKENSPLFSNKVLDIEINEETGEAFFATDKGLISYRSKAIKARGAFTDVVVFPNPVRPDYEGLITIKGLISNTVVKITDVSGNLIYETKSLGGQASWDGRSFNGEKAHSGVYLIFCSDEDGNTTHVTKLLFVRG